MSSGVCPAWSVFRPRVGGDSAFLAGNPGREWEVQVEGVILIGAM
jgi:hypothetical protein